MITRIIPSGRGCPASPGYLKEFEMGHSMKHGPEPWYIDRDDRPGMSWNMAIGIRREPYKQVCFMAHSESDNNVEGNANAERIVSCVNACAGIENPEVIPEVIANLDNFLRSLSMYHDAGACHERIREVRDQLIVDRKL